MTELELDNSKKKDYLNSYKNLCRKLSSLEDQLQSIREIKQSAKYQVLSDMPKGSKQSDLSDYMVQLDNLMTKIIKARTECVKRKIEIEKAIMELKDGTESIILHKRYIEFKPWEKICVEIDYSWRQTHRVHSEALMNIRI